MPDLHVGQSDGLLEPLLQVGVDSTQVPLILGQLLQVGLHLLLLLPHHGQLVLALKLLPRHPLQVLAQLGLQASRVQQRDHVALMENTRFCIGWKELLEYY